MLKIPEETGRVKITSKKIDLINLEFMHIIQKIFPFILLKMFQSQTTVIHHGFVPAMGFNKRK